MDSGPGQLVFVVCCGLVGFFFLSDTDFQLGSLSPFECGKYRNYLTTKWERICGSGHQVKSSQVNRVCLVNYFSF
jgi:hypothetical protein